MDREICFEHRPRPLSCANAFIKQKLNPVIATHALNLWTPIPGGAFVSPPLCDTIAATIDAVNSNSNSNIEVIYRRADVPRQANTDRMRCSGRGGTDDAKARQGLQTAVDFLRRAVAGPTWFLYMWHQKGYRVPRGDDFAYIIFWTALISFAGWAFVRAIAWTLDGFIGVTPEFGVTAEEGPNGWYHIVTVDGERLRRAGPYPSQGSAIAVANNRSPGSRSRGDRPATLPPEFGGSADAAGAKRRITLENVAGENREPNRGRRRGPVRGFSRNLLKYNEP